MKIQTLIKIIKNPLFLYHKLKHTLKQTSNENFFNKNFVKKILKKKNTFKAYYDLNYNSISFNFVPFLLLVENFCSDNNYESYEIVIVPDNLDKSLKWKDLFDQYGEEAINYRILNLMPNLCSLGGKCRGFSFLPNRKNVQYLLNSEDIFPVDYGSEMNGVKGGFDHSLHYYLKKNGIKRELSAPKHSQEILNNLLNTEKKIITFTIRNSKFDKSRNSPIDDFIKFSESLNKSYKIVFIPDSDQPNIKENPDFNFCKIGTAAAYNPGIRLALYKKAYLNFFSDNGPATLAMYSKNIRYILFYNIEKSLITDEAIKKEVFDHTFDSNKQFFWSNKNYQLVFFGIDNYENLKKAHNLFLKNNDKQL